MKNSHKLKLLSILLFFTTKLFAQEIVKKGDMVIHVKIQSSMSISALGPDLLNINKYGNRADIIYAKFNRIAYNEVDKDTAYINLNIDLNHLDPQKTRRLRPIYDRHSVYDTTKVTVDLKTDSVYFNILQSLAQSPEQELEKSKVGERFYLDGFSFSCVIITATETKNINIHTPTAETHPVISALLEQSYNRLWPKRKTTK